jgi:hypothetical protein
VPPLTATYHDPAPGSPGTLWFQLCNDASCGDVRQVGSAAGIAVDADGAWSPS